MRPYNEGNTYKVMQQTKKKWVQDNEVRKDLAFLKRLVSPFPKSKTLREVLPETKLDITKLTAFRVIKYKGRDYLSNRGLLLEMGGTLEELF